MAEPGPNTASGSTSYRSAGFLPTLPRPLAGEVGARSATGEGGATHAEDAASPAVPDQLSRCISSMRDVRICHLQPGPPHQLHRRDMPRPAGRV